MLPLRFVLDLSRESDLPYPVIVWGARKSPAQVGRK